MKRSIAIWMIFILLATSPMFMFGCSDKAYVANMKMRENTTLFRENSRARAMEAISGSIKIIIDTVEGEYVKQETDKATKNSFVDKLGSTNGNNFAIAVLGDIVVTMSNNQMKAEMMRARAQAISYLQPIVESIYNGIQERDPGTPTTMNDIGKTLMGHVPFLATVAGMYGLGYQGMKSAGDTITNTFGGDNNGLMNTKGNLADNGGVIGDNNVTNANQKGVTGGEMSEEVPAGPWEEIDGCSGPESYFDCNCTSGPDYCDGS